MRRQVRVSSHPNGGRRVQKKERELIHLQSKEEAVSKATEIARSVRAELKIARKGEEPKRLKSYGGDPFPPRDRTIRCGRSPFPPKTGKC